MSYNIKDLRVKAGLWIDHRGAIIVVLMETEEETKRHFHHDPARLL
jgi:hypothetical protein